MDPSAESSHPRSMRDDADEDLVPGTVVGEYVISQKIGAGAFGDVYAGEHPIIGKKVAVKVLRRHVASDPDMISRLIAEARAVNKIRQINIVDIFSFGLLEDQQRHYIVMELLEGQTLGDLLRKNGRVSIAKVIHILQGIAAALDAVHEAGITHRDLKPDNVFLTMTRDGSYTPKLLDFGMAKLMGDDVAHRTSAGAVIGTPMYMSPEQARGKSADSRADIYALGVITHEMLTGTPPFLGDSGIDVLVQHVSEQPPPMSTICPDVPKVLDAPVLAMLAKRPGDRPATAGEAVRALVEHSLSMFENELTGNDTGESNSRPGSQELTPPELVSSADSNSGAPRERPKVRTENSHAFNGLSDNHRTEKETSASPPSPRIWIFVAAAMLGLGTWGILRMTKRSPNVTEIVTHGYPRPSTSAIEPAPTPSIVPTAVPTTISLRLDTQPADVEVWVDDRKLGNTSSPMILPRNTQPMVLQLKKPGFKDLRIEVIPDRDQARTEVLVVVPNKTRATNDPAGKQDALEKVLGGRD